MNLYQISTEIKGIYNSLQNGEGVDLETGEINPEMMEKLQIRQQDLQSKAVDYAYVIKSFENEIELYDKEIKRLTEEKKKIQNIKERIKILVSNAMIEFDIGEIKGNTVKLSFRESESVEIQDIDLLSEEYKRTKITVEPDKTAIKNAIKNGIKVEGASLIKNKNLQIR